METKTVHIEMDCIHNHVENTMTCSWLNGRVRIVVDYKAAQLGIMRDCEVIDTRDIEGMSIDEFVALEEQCQEAAETLAKFEN